MCARKCCFPRSRPRNPYAPRACIRRSASPRGRAPGTPPGRNLGGSGRNSIHEGGAIRLPDFNVRIAEERPEVIEEASEAHPLKIDEYRLSV